MIHIKLLSPDPSDREGMTSEEFDRRKSEDIQKDKLERDSSIKRTDDSEDISQNTTDKTTLDDALQQWANDNARDIAEDNSTPLRSNL